MTQNSRILAHLQKGKKLTPIKALDSFGCFRLSARIQNLRDAGHNIRTDLVTVGNKTFASYSLNK